MKLTISEHKVITFIKASILVIKFPAFFPIQCIPVICKNPGMCFFLKMKLHALLRAAAFKSFGCKATVLTTDYWKNIQQ